MTKQYEILEVCLNEIEQGVNIDTVLSRYPEHADELRPVVEASVQAKDMAVPAPSPEVVKRNRAKILQRAAEMRETRTARWTWSLPLSRAFVSLAALLIFLFSGTGLVQAASASLPGDGLYPVKRAWESMLLFTTLDVQERNTLQLENEYERLEEIQEVLKLGRSAGVDFSGYVTRQNGDEWRVSGVTVFISSRTQMPDQPVQTGMAVHVIGQTQNEIGVAADRIRILPADYKVPKIEDENELGEEQVPDVESTPPVDEEADSGGVSIPLPEEEPDEETIEGIVKIIQNDYMVIDGVIIDMRFAEIKGNQRVGVSARADGYYGADGIFIALEIEFKGIAPSDSRNNPANNNSNNNANSNDNDNDDDDNHNDSNDNEPDDN
ncbi:MAG TPA: DUF5667 domain-containing protein [Anaerolineales bacterium]|nr:DUF5667 domain-containing protein [Anaerolineales bacterium]